MAQTGAIAARSQGEAIEAAGCRGWERRAGYRHPIQIQGRAVSDKCIGREFFGRRSDGAVVSGSQPHEMASGSYHMVLRNVRVASVP